MMTSELSTREESEAARSSVSGDDRCTGRGSLYTWSYTVWLDVITW